MAKVLGPTLVAAGAALILLASVASGAPEALMRAGQWQRPSAPCRQHGLHESGGRGPDLRELAVHVHKPDRRRHGLHQGPGRLVLLLGRIWGQVIYLRARNE